MDQLMIDVGDDPVEVGDEVVLIGRQGEAFARVLCAIEMSAEALRSPMSSCRRQRPRWCDMPRIPGRIPSVTHARVTK